MTTIFIQVAALVSPDYAQKVAPLEHQQDFFINIGRESGTTLQYEATHNCWQLCGDLEGISKAHRIMAAIQQLVSVPNYHCPAHAKAQAAKITSSSNESPQVDLQSVEPTTPVKTISPDQVQTSTPGQISGLSPRDNVLTTPKKDEKQAKLMPKPFTPPKTRSRSMNNTSTQTLSCADCGRKYHRKSHLQKHMETKHGKKALDINTHLPGKQDGNSDSHFVEKERDKLISLMPVQTVPRRTQQAAAQRIKDKYRSRFCYQCQKAFSTYSNLERHLKIIHGGFRYRCFDCSKVFTCRDTLGRHNRVHHKNLRCLKCLHLCQTEKERKRHVCANRRKERLKCEECKRTYSGSLSLHKHYRNVHKGKIFSCEFCAAPCDSNPALFEHYLSIHNMYKCLECEAIFAVEAEFSIHECSTVDPGSVENQVVPANNDPVSLITANADLKMTFNNLSAAVSVQDMLDNDDHIMGGETDVQNVSIVSKESQDISIHVVGQTEFVEQITRELKSEEGEEAVTNITGDSPVKAETCEILISDSFGMDTSAADSSHNTDKTMQSESQQNKFSSVSPTQSNRLEVSHDDDVMGLMRDLTNNEADKILNQDSHPQTDQPTSMSAVQSKDDTMLDVTGTVLQPVPQITGNLLESVNMMQDIQQPMSSRTNTVVMDAMHHDTMNSQMSQQNSMLQELSHAKTLIQNSLMQAQSIQDMAGQILQPLNHPQKLDNSGMPMTQNCGELQRPAMYQPNNMDTPTLQHPSAGGLHHSMGSMAGLVMPNPPNTITSEYGTAARDEASMLPPGVPPLKTVEDETKQKILNKLNKQRTCDICNKVFSCSGNLSKHIRNIHNNKERLPCEMCPMTFASHQQLTRHMRVIHNDALFNCHCNFQCSSHKELIKHQLETHGTQVMDDCFQCEICGKAFLYDHNLKRHVKKEHSSLSGDQLSGAALTPEQLLAENKLKTPNKRQSCDICTKSYKTKQKLREHITSVHTSTMPFSCGKCGKRFNRQSSVSFHWRRCDGIRTGSGSESMLGSDTESLHSATSREELLAKVEEGMDDGMFGVTLSELSYPNSTTPSYTYNTHMDLNSSPSEDSLYTLTTLTSVSDVRDDKSPKPEPTPQSVQQCSTPQDNNYIASQASDPQFTVLQTMPPPRGPSPALLQPLNDVKENHGLLPTRNPMLSQTASLLQSLSDPLSFDSLSPQGSQFTMLPPYNAISQGSVPLGPLMTSLIHDFPPPPMPLSSLPNPVQPQLTTLTSQSHTSATSSVCTTGGPALPYSYLDSYGSLGGSTLGSSLSSPHLASYESAFTRVSSSQHGDVDKSSSIH